METPASGLRLWANVPEGSKRLPIRSTVKDEFNGELLNATLDKSAPAKPKSIHVSVS
jgi:hypothetical protein